MSLTIITSILAAYLLTVVGVGWWRRVALRQRILDVPNERSSHVQPTPRGGGIIISAVTMILLVVGALFNGNLSEVVPLLGAAAMIAVVSWFDDLYSLPSVLRFGVHLLAAVMVVFSLGFFAAVELPFVQINLTVYYLGQIVTVLWIVGLTNAYNFMDGIDGIAGAQGVTAGIGWATIGLLTEQPFVTLYGGLLASTCLGFLWHNWHPAKIFMGDVSSAYLGFSFAALPLLTAKNSLLSERLPVIGLVLVWAFVFDAALTFVRRAVKGENVFAAHRSHLYQRLVIAGLGHDTVTSLYVALSVFGVAAAIVWLTIDDNWFRLATLSAIALCAALLWIFVGAVERKTANRKNEEI